MHVPDWARLLRCTECGERDADFVVSGNCVSIFWPESSSEHMPEIPMLIWYKERVCNGAKADAYFGVSAPNRQGCE